MDLPLSDLPDDVDALKAMVLALAREQAAKEVRLKVAEAEIARLEAVEKSANERIANLTLIMKVLQRTQNGKRSERLRLGVNDEQVSFAFEEVETGLSAIRSELDRAAKDKPKRAPRPRKGFAAHLERIEEVIEPEIPAGCEGLAKVLIGEDRSERLDVVPPKFRVIVTRRPKYAFRGSDGVVQALAPAHIIEGGLPTERLLAYIAVSKYADGLPLYRQEAIYLRDGVEISRSLMAQWMGHLGFELQMLADYILERVKEGERIFADETTLPTLAPGSGKTTKAWLWAYARDDRPYGGTSPPMVAYRFEDSRGADCVTRHLSGFTGILQVDGYSAYTNLAKTRAKTGSNETVQLAGCWAHLRRKFYDLHISGVSQAATDTVLAMTELWRIEDEVRGKDADSRAARRQEKSSTTVASLFELWEKELGKVSGKSKTAEAIRYALTRREALERFLTDGRIEIDSNIVERAIRPQTITRKNSLFAGSEGGGRTWATVATLLQTCKMNGVDPLDWLSQTLTRIAQGWPASEIEALMPWNFRSDAVS
ncbi:IS66 family transposase [Sinorhizobium meliloti]|jgi:transposase|uniref:IS66 family transposase n=14 Tax=Sinorhizobium/Ensifer group TaxID=227292 RepID=I2E1U4_RHIML|nr:MULTISPECIES: IS66 family transposase [Sinorhizobium/Ensifer group]AEG57795.1 transposase IS66 [Sinorhizobium meliloti AK83]AFJ91462.1 IS66 family transposase [Sinorhizobium meliloti]AFJ91602.1 IS66 family transposase 3 [Sinorhizobium meliloti]MBM3096278.1 IS66 family transposase [Ensifer canadensis]MDE3795733.1 IS66 family transposase [Sinorhizobium meliloti]